MTGEDQPKYVTTGRTNPVCYHVDEDCPRLVRMSNYTERDERYIEFQELEPCRFCGTDKEVKGGYPVKE